VYDHRLGAWRVTWNGPIQGVRRTFIARRLGDTIVQKGKTEQGQPLRWIFSDIREDSFRWRSVHTTDGEQSWRLREEMDVQRKPAQGSVPQLAGRANSHGATSA
jgi:hypothetical protein